MLLSSPIFQGSGGDFPRRKAGRPRHARQGFQEEELGESWRFNGGDGPALELPTWPGSAPRAKIPSCHPSLFPASSLFLIRIAPLYTAAYLEHGHTRSHHHASAQGMSPSRLRTT